MYYYIFEPPRNSAERAYYERIRDIAREFSIVGEITQASPARSPEELTQMALDKNYTTIVAVGGDNHINKISSQIVSQPPGYSVGLGLISMDTDSMLYERWGFRNPIEACETLKYRRLARVDVGLVEPNHYFITSAKIEPSKPTRIILEVDRWRAEGIIDRIEISSNLYILMERYVKEPSTFKSAFNWLLGKPAIKSDQSIFKAKLIRVDSAEPVPIVIGNEIIAKTPVNIYRKLNALNVIAKRDRIRKES